MCAFPSGWWGPSALHTDTPHPLALGGSHGSSLRSCCGRGFEDAYAAAREPGTGDGATGDARSRKRKAGKARGAANPAAARAEAILAGGAAAAAQGSAATATEDD